MEVERRRPAKVSEGDLAADGVKRRQQLLFEQSMAELMRRSGGASSAAEARASPGQAAPQSAAEERRARDNAEDEAGIWVLERAQADDGDGDGAVDKGAASAAPLTRKLLEGGAEAASAAAAPRGSSNEQQQAAAAAQGREGAARAGPGAGGEGEASDGVADAEGANTNNNDDDDKQEEKVERRRASSTRVELRADENNCQASSAPTRDVPAAAEAAAAAAEAPERDAKDPSSTAAAAAAAAAEPSRGSAAGEEETRIKLGQQNSEPIRLSTQLQDDDSAGRETEDSSFGGRNLIEAPRLAGGKKSISSPDLTAKQQQQLFVCGASQREGASKKKGLARKVSRLGKSVYNKLIKRKTQPANLNELANNSSQTSPQTREPPFVSESEPGSASSSLDEQRQQQQVIGGRLVEDGSGAIEVAEPSATTKTRKTTENERIVLVESREFIWNKSLAAAAASNATGNRQLLNRATDTPDSTLTPLLTLTRPSCARPSIAGASDIFSPPEQPASSCANENDDADDDFEEPAIEANCSASENHEAGEQPRAVAETERNEEQQQWNLSHQSLPTASSPPSPGSSSPIARAKQLFARMFRDRSSTSSNQQQQQDHNFNHKHNQKHQNLANSESRMHHQQPPQRHSSAAAAAASAAASAASGADLATAVELQTPAGCKYRFR